jgi:hypothetical protein
VLIYILILPKYLVPITQAWKKQKLFCEKAETIFFFAEVNGLRLGFNPSADTGSDGIGENLAASIWRLLT